MYRENLDISGDTRSKMPGNFDGCRRKESIRHPWYISLPPEIIDSRRYWRCRFPRCVRSKRNSVAVILCFIILPWRLMGIFPYALTSSIYVIWRFVWNLLQSEFRLPETAFSVLWDLIGFLEAINDIEGQGWVFSEICRGMTETGCWLAPGLYAFYAVSSYEKELARSK